MASSSGLLLEFRFMRWYTLAPLASIFLLIQLNELLSHGDDLAWKCNVFAIVVVDVVTEFIEGLVETYPGLQYLDGFPQVIILFFLFCFLFLYY